MPLTLININATSWCYKGSMEKGPVSQVLKVALTIPDHLRRSRLRFYQLVVSSLPMKTTFLRYSSCSIVFINVVERKRPHLSKGLAGLQMFLEFVIAYNSDEVNKCKVKSLLFSLVHVCTWRGLGRPYIVRIEFHMKNTIIMLIRSLSTHS